MRGSVLQGKGLKTRFTDQVDVLFVNPPSPDRFIYIRDINRHGRSSWERMIWPQTNLAILAATAEQLGLSVEVVDCIGYGLSWSDYEEIVKTTKPKFCFSNLISVTYRNDVEALSLAKKISNAVTVGMGPHITNSPEHSLMEAECLDFVIRHEAEDTLRELLEVHLTSTHITLDRLSNIDGIAFVPSRIDPKLSTDVIVTGQRSLIRDLDELPRARYDLLPLDRYWAPFLGNYLFIESSRGCPYRCTFCRQGIMYRWEYRTRSGHSLAREALDLHSRGVSSVLFHGDTFTVDQNMVNDLCDELIAAGSPVRWACNAHASTLKGKSALVEKMKTAGCWMIAIGIESGSNEILRNIKKQTNTKVVRDVVQEIHKVGIQVWGYFVIGFPGETKHTIKETIQFATSLPLTIAKFDIGAPYPGTEFHKYVVENKFIRAKYYEDFDQNSSAIVDYPDLTFREIKAGVRQATRRFYLRPRVLMHVFREIIDVRSAIAVVLIIRDFLTLLTRKKRRSGLRQSMANVKNV